VTETVVLTVGLAADSCEAVAVHNALETLTFRGTDHVHERNFVAEDVSDREDVTELELFGEVGGEFHELALGSGTGLFEMPHQRRAGVLFSGFVIGKLYSFVTVGLNCTDLRDNARTSLDNSARYVLTVGTENGSHSDFFSN
jgi:hypothetical protein